jgi:protein-tyrosine kinase
MDNITRALKRAKEETRVRNTDLAEINLFKLSKPMRELSPEREPAAPFQDLESIETEIASPAHLRAQRVVAFDSGDRITRFYDMLRNQLLNFGVERQGRVIAVVAPTHGCGTTVTAINLALSYARTPGANVLLVDANVRAPSIGCRLGQQTPAEADAHEDRLSGHLKRVEIAGLHISVLRIAADGASNIPFTVNRIESQIGRATQKLRPSVVILDLPPMLIADEAIALVQHADSIVLVLAFRQSKLSDLEVCKTHIGAQKETMFILNKNPKYGL